MTLLMILIGIVDAPGLPEASVQTPASEIEGVYLPAGFTGPIVAAPFTTRVF